MFKEGVEVRRAGLVTLAARGARLLLTALVLACGCEGAPGEPGPADLAAGGAADLASGATDMTPDLAVRAVDCPAELDCEFIPAGYQVTNPMTGAYGNYDVADRPADGLDIRYIVIHDTEVSYDTTIKIFKDPANGAAAHYVVRSEDGHVVEMVPPQSVAWHAGNWYINMHSIGIEHIGFAFEGYKWYSEPMYQASARLVRYLGKRYNIPLDRAHIFGHEEVPGVNVAKQKTMHWDPGAFWDWDHYMQLVQQPADERSDDGRTGVVAIRPAFAENRPLTSYCYGPDQASDCRAQPLMPANFLYLRTMPDAMAPFLSNPYLTWPDDRLYNWGNKVVTGQRYVRSGMQGDWDAIDFSGVQGWFYNPGRKATRAVAGQVVTPKQGLASAPVYGVGYAVDPAAYVPPTLPPLIEKIYDLPAGQRYSASGPFNGDYYWAKTYAPTLAEAKHVRVKDGTAYYEIIYNHRLGLVRASDVEVIQLP